MATICNGLVCGTGEMLLRSGMSGEESFWKPRATMVCRAKEEEVTFKTIKQYIFSRQKLITNSENEQM